MILRKFQLQQAVILSLYLLTTTSAQNAQTYDENEWIPIAPSNSPETKKPQGRVLNLAPSSKNYFADDYITKAPPSQQYRREQLSQKEPNVRQQPYKFESVLPQYVQQNQFIAQPGQPQYIQGLPYVQTLQQVQQVPPPEQHINQQLVAPPQSTQNYYDSTKGLQASNVAVLNQELIGAIQNQNTNQIPVKPSATKPKEESEDVQLLYVPLENLQLSQPVTQPPRVKVTEPPRRIKQAPNRVQPKINQLNIQEDFIRQALAAHKLQEQLQLGEPVLLQQSTTTTTERPKKRKANQPPLAVYMEKQGAADIKEVLQVLKNVKSIDVQDSAGPGSPKVFVGPSNINPEGYTKFPLPYLSSVQGNRIERKVEQLPFFVAPLSYKTPEGYSKIPLPSPHVGSVVISTKNQLHEKHPELRQPQTAQNQIVPDFDAKQPFNLREQSKPSSYLDDSQSSTSLFGFGNEFLSDYSNTPQQNYEVSSSKSFTNDYPVNPKENFDQQNLKEISAGIPSYQSSLVDNSNQYYQTTPNYKSSQNTNVRSTFAPPEYDDRENSKELIRNYDVPSVPVVSTSNYQASEKPQINQFPDSFNPTPVTPKSPADVYNLNDTPIRQSTTALPVIRQKYNTRGSGGQDPFRQIINQYEIEQINNQFRDDTPEYVESIRSTTPATASTRRYEDVPSSTARSRSRSRHRGRTTTTTTTTTTTPKSIVEENYTVLEEFAIQPKTSTTKYTTEVETIPANVYKLEPEGLRPVFSQSQTPPKQESYSPEVEGPVPNQTPYRQKSYNQDVLSQAGRGGVRQLENQTPSKQESYSPEVEGPVPNQTPYRQESYNQDVSSQAGRGGVRLLENQTPSRQENYNQDVLAQSPRGGIRQRNQTPSRQESYNPDVLAQTPRGGVRQFGSQTPSKEESYNQDFLSQSPRGGVPQLGNQTPSKQESYNQDVLAESPRGGVPQLGGLDSFPTNQNTAFNQQIPNSDTPSSSNIDFSNQFTYNNAPLRQTTNFNQDVPHSRPNPTADFNQELLQSQVPSEIKGEEAFTDTQDPRLTPLVYNRGQEQQKEEPVEPVNPYLSGLISNLQNQAVRPLLVPNLLVPTTEKLATIPPQPITEEIRTTTTTTTEAPVETTTTRRSRGRQRGQTAKSSSTSAPRRTANRRRPSYTRPTTERQYARTTTEATSEYEPTRRVSNQRQRFRTRGRTTEKEKPATERVFQTTENIYRHPPVEESFQKTSAEPESYIQFDHVIQNQQIITEKPQQSAEDAPMKEYHQVYSLPSQTQSVENLPEEISSTSKPVVDVKITHPVNEPVIVSTPRDDSRFHRVNGNIQSGGVIYNKNEEVTSRAPARSRTRIRTRGRHSSTTPRTVTTTTTTKPQQEENEEEFYGFIRKPNFNQPAPVVHTTQQPVPVYSSSYQQSPRTVVYLDENSDEVQKDDSESIKFVGQIKPKYTTTEAQDYSTEAPKVRSRARIRVPNRNVTPHYQSANEVNTQKLDDQVTRRSSVVRSRNRGKSHYKPPQNQKQKNDDQDVEGGNYPVPYLKQRQLTTEKPSSFQITVNPGEEIEYDQEPHSSLYSPQIIRNTDTQWVEASILPELNDLEIENKQIDLTSSEEQTTIPVETTEYEQTETEKVKDEEDTLTTTETIETTPIEKQQKPGKRRGAWKLVKHTAIDPFETAESQNYLSVLNAFENIGKVEKKNNFIDFTTTSTETTTTTTNPPTTTSITSTPKTTSFTTTTENSIFDALYSMLGFASKASQSPQNKTKVTVQKEITTTTVSPTFPEEYTEGITQDIKQEDDNITNETTIIPEISSTPVTTTTEESIENTDSDPWDSQNVKTSTSTEISHETEICFKGRCVKSRDSEPRL